MDRKTELLKRIPLFGNLNEQELLIITGYTQLTAYKEGSILFKNGDRSTSCFIVDKGEIRIVQDAYLDRDNTLAFFIEGEIFGEFDLFENDPRTATAIAHCDSSLLIFPGEGHELEVLYNKHPDIFVKMYHTLITLNAGRIRRTNKVITEKSSWINDLKEQMYKDKLTNFYNQTYLDDEFPGLLKQFDKTGLLVVKPDDFKSVNDTFGHEAGDRALKAISSTVITALGDNEIPIRFRGNEFIVAYFDRSADEAIESAQALFRKLSDLDIGHLIADRTLKLTYSMGLAEYPAQGETIETVIQLAYAKMFEQRDSGGSGIRTAETLIDNLIPFLQTVTVFSPLYISELKIISGFLKPHTYKQDSIICSEGDEGNELFIIESGGATASIRVDDDEEKIISEFSPGDFFGEMAIFENALRSATITAREDSVILALDKNDFFSLMDKWPLVAIKIMRGMLDITSGRLSSTGRFISEMVKWGDNASRRAITDELSGLYNRRYLDSSLTEQFGKAQRNGSTLSIIMADLDLFREVNESYSHETGDRYIVEVASIFKKCLRSTDIIARYGGDEFTIVLPDTDIASARQLAENIRAAVAKLDFLKELPGPDLHLSTSLGLAAFPDHCSSIEDLKKRADEALYKAKETGRNKVVFCGD